MTGRFEPSRRPPARLLKDSTCNVCYLEGPDQDGNYDLLENDRCPIHGAGPVKSGVLRRGNFGRMLQRSKEDRDAA